MMDFSDMSFADEPINRQKIKNATLSLKEEKKEVNIQESQSQKNDLEQYITLEQLHKYIMEMSHPLKATCRSTVIFSGNKNSPLMIIGEAPGATEDEQALPFVGDSGKLLNNLLKSVDIDRNKVYVTNLVFFRPPANRKPDLKEINFFWPFLKRQIELQKPRIILVLGATASCNFTPEPIAKARGKFVNFNNIPVLFSFHPSYLLRLPKMQLLAQQDFNILKNFLVEKNLFSELKI